MAQQGCSARGILPIPNASCMTTIEDRGMANCAVTSRSRSRHVVAVENRGLRTIRVEFSVVVTQDRLEFPRFLDAHGQPDVSWSGDIIAPPQLSVPPSRDTQCQPHGIDRGAAHVFVNILRSWRWSVTQNGWSGPFPASNPVLSLPIHTT